jgi:hypothetical protein
MESGSRIFYTDRQTAMKAEVFDGLFRCFIERNISGESIPPYHGGGKAGCFAYHGGRQSGVASRTTEWLLCLADGAILICLL